MTTVLWLLKEDMVFEFVAAIVALLIGIYSLRAYSMTKKKNMMFFSAGFGFLFLALVCRFIFDYLVDFEDGNMERFMLGYHSHLVYLTRFLLIGFMLFTYSGYLSILMSHLKRSEIHMPIIMMLLALLATFTSTNFYFSFYLICIILIGLILIHLRRNYLNLRSRTSGLVFVAFICLFVAQIFFMLVWFSITYYYIANMLVLIGFLLFLAVLVKVIK